MKKPGPQSQKPASRKDAAVKSAAPKATASGPSHLQAAIDAAERLGSFTGAGGETLEADATLGNSGPALFDGLVLPDGEPGVKALAKVGQTKEYVVNQYRHCKTILALGASAVLLDEAALPPALPSGSPGPGVLRAASGGAAVAAADFVDALAKHRHYERETDPPMV